MPHLQGLTSVVMVGGFSGSVHVQVRVVYYAPHSNGALHTRTRRDMSLLDEGPMKYYFLGRRKWSQVLRTTHTHFPGLRRFEISTSVSFALKKKVSFLTQMEKRGKHGNRAQGTTKTNLFPCRHVGQFECLDDRIPVDSNVCACWVHSNNWLSPLAGHALGARFRRQFLFVTCRHSNQPPAKQIIIISLLLRNFLCFPLRSCRSRSNLVSSGSAPTATSTWPWRRAPTWRSFKGPRTLCDSGGSRRRCSTPWRPGTSRSFVRPRTGSWPHR